MRSPYAMRALLVTFHLLIGFIAAFEKVDSCKLNQKNSVIIGKIVGVFEESSRVGKEMKIASEMAVNDFYVSTACNYKVVLVSPDSGTGSSDQIASSVKDLIDTEQVVAIIGAVHVSPSAKPTRTIPIISILPTATSSPPHPQFLHVTTQLSATTQCIATIVNHFRWRRVTAIYESSSDDDSSSLVAQFADSLDRVNSAIESTRTISRVDSVEGELRKLRGQKNRVFVVLRGSLEFCKALFGKAEELGMMEKGFVWIVSEDISNMIDSIEAEFVAANMEGVIGLKTDYVDTSQDYKKFKHIFRKRYGQRYPEEEEFSNPSLYALRAYDLTMTIANAMKKLLGMNDSRELLEIISSSKLKGLSGDISFKNGELSNSPTFRVINIVGKSYREIAFWSPSSGFSGDLEGKKSTLKGLSSELGIMYWPGGLTKIPKGWSLGSEEKPLKVGVPAGGVFKQFIKINYDKSENGTYVSGFSVDVFEAVVRQLPYQLPYVLIPFYGNYDAMIDAVFNKTLDAGLGDTEIMADRYEHAEFTQPYLESGLVMVVPVKQDKTKELWMFMKAFKFEMWVLMPTIHLFTSLIVWFIERKENNEDFGGTLSQQLAGVLWFSFTLVFFAQRESIKSNLSRIALAPWLFVILIVAACFTAVLTSMITVSNLHPSVINVEYLKNTNAAIGCNEDSFISKYLINVLHFKPENLREINSIQGYPNAFDTGEIAAAFFVKPHAKAFLSKYCKGYVIAGPSFTLGGFGIAFPRGSPLVTDMSEAILKVTQSGEIQEMEKEMLFSSNCSSSTDPTDDTSLGPWPFSGLFIISGAISTIVFFTKVVNLLDISYPNAREILKWVTSFIFPMNGKIESENSISQINTVERCVSIELPCNQDTVITCIQEENRENEQ